MASDDNLIYEGLFASNAPDPLQAQKVSRCKYDFAVAYPDPASLPLDDLVAGLRDALQEEGRDLAVYPDVQGYQPLREYVTDKLALDRNIHVSPDEVFLMDGSSQPIHALAEALLDPGDVVITDHFVYSGTLRTFNRFRADIRGVKSDDDGILLDAVEDTIRVAISEGKKPKLIYSIPMFQNPQGWTLSLERRRELVGMSHRYNVPIMEDDCYVDLRYDGEPVTSIHSQDESGQVMYVGSFSKIIAPGMRMGYMTAPAEVMDMVRVIKSGGGVNPFAALAVHRYATTGLSGHIDNIVEILRVKRDTMLAALGENFGSSAEWSHPNGGLYIWLRLPEGSDLVEARAAALEADVGYHPGPMFAPDAKSGRNYARLCFGYNTPEDIREGVARLAEVFANRGYLNM